MIWVEPATLPWMEALAEDDDAFASRFGIPVVRGWAGFPEAVPAAAATLRADPEPAWGPYLFFDGDGALVGFGGWKGPPHDGRVELRYAVAPERQGRGIATAVVRDLVARARAAGVIAVLAHTRPETSASTTVLRRCGFRRAGEVVDPDEGVTWRWELRAGFIRASTG
ncbi:MAG TPA: GNAT family N-acetyltransferase [Acidimicrobiales bacterium]|nr:GNAT family N-acetyltransferase [Acidimicrobiales bacterium]